MNVPTLRGSGRSTQMSLLDPGGFISCGLSHPLQENESGSEAEQRPLCLCPMSLTVDFVPFVVHGSP